MDIGELFEKIDANDHRSVCAAFAAEPALASARDPYLGSSPLIFAAHRGFREIVDGALAAGVDVHVREQASGSTALHWAAEGGHPEIAKTLLDRGAELEPRDTWFQLTPLGWATVVDWAPRFRENRPATIELLRSRGAQSDLFVAVARGDAALVRALVERGREVLLTRLGFVLRGMSALHLAVSRGDLAMTELLLELGADPRERTMWGLDALALALDRKNDAIVSALRARGVGPTVASALIAGDAAELGRRIGAEPTADASVLLLSACERGDAGCARTLLGHGARVNASVESLLGELPAPVTALHVAAREGHAECVAVLLDAGALPSPGIEAGLPTPLHLAAGRGHVDVVRALLAKGAARDARERGFGATPEGWAAREGQDAVVALLRA